MEIKLHSFLTSALDGPRAMSLTRQTFYAEEQLPVEAVRNVMAHGDAWEGK